MKSDEIFFMINSAPADTSANFDTPSLSDGLIHGNIQTITSSTFNGTTSTLALQGSNTGTNWSTIYQDDGTTAVSFTLATNSTYNVLLKRILYKYYRFVYTKGNASAGTITSTFVGKH